MARLSFYVHMMTIFFIITRKTSVRGFKVGATSSTIKLELLKSLGANIAIDFTKHNFDGLRDTYDVVYDAIGQPEKAVKAVKEGGSAISIIGPTPPSRFSFVPTPDGTILTKLTRYSESGYVKVVRDPKTPFSFEMLRRLTLTLRPTVSHNK